MPHDHVTIIATLTAPATAVRIPACTLDSGVLSRRLRPRARRRCLAIVGYIGERLRASDSALVVKWRVDILDVIYALFGASPDGRAYRKYIVGTTTMFRSVEVIKPQRITMAIGV